MTIPAAQQEVSAFLAGLAGEAPVETHISLVFRGADTVWKLKKAVALPYLDFSTAAARRHFCLRELELNAAAAPGLYRDVVPVLRGADGALAFGTMEAADHAIDWVLRMARIPETDFLDRIAACDGLDAPLLDALADTVAAYHETLQPAPGIAPAEAMRRVFEGNLSAGREAGLDPQTLETWRAAMVPALQRLAPWLDRRGAEGRVRRGHGDLHLGNLCLWQGRPVPFDALEFDEDLATIDLGYDLAFLLMDLERRAGRFAANRVLNRYVARTGDAELLHGLAVFLSMRAIIRAHVQASRHDAGGSRSYLAAACGYLRPAAPVVVATGGLQGSGKSTLARSLAPELGAAPGALIVRSDEIRKRLHGVAPETKLPQSAYGRTANQRVFAELIREVTTAARAGHAVIADATWIDLGQRDALLTAANAAGSRFVGLWLEAPLNVLAARIDARDNDASDATSAVLRQAARARGARAGDWIAVHALDQAAALDAARRAVISPPGLC